MSDGDWDKVVKRAQDICLGCGQGFTDGDEMVSALVMGAEGFERVDRHDRCGSNAEAESFSIWRWRRAAALRPGPRRLDLGFLSEFFRRLDGREEPEARRTAWIVALLLLRKKVLEQVDRQVVEGVEVLSLRFRDSERIYPVADPKLDAEAMQSVEADLGRIFNLEGSGAPAGQDASG